MKKLSIILLLCLSLQGLMAQESNSNDSKVPVGKFGLGLTLLGPTGITGKYFLDEKLSIEGSLGLGTFTQGKFHIHGVLLYDFYKINNSMSVYAGGGLVIEDRYLNANRFDKTGIYKFKEGYERSFGIRAPIGLSWKSEDKKFELSGEVFLNAFLTGKEGTEAGIALAGRYYF